MEISEVRAKAQALEENIAKVIVGKEEVIRKVIVSLLAGGHILLEDVPGTGKTMLAKSLARSLETDFKRIQFTPDLLPNDLIGINFYNQKAGDFVFRPGAVFTNVLLADEINRATPRTQSSLLESMEERQVTVDGTTYPLAKPFFVIATQNPVETQGTFPLPEAQLDRFLMKLSLGYTDKEQSVEILNRFIKETPLEELSAVLSAADVCEMQAAIKTVYVHPDLARYSVEICEKTRRPEGVLTGVSTRGNIAFVRAAQALAAINGRDFVTPDDFKALAVPVLGHRLIIRGALKSRQNQLKEIIENILSEVAVPTEEWSAPAAK